MKDGGELTHMPHGHPELGSGSEDSNRQMLNQRSTPEGAKVKQVQHDKSGMVSMTDAEPKVDARRGLSQTSYSLCSSKILFDFLIEVWLA